MLSDNFKTKMNKLLLTTFLLTSLQTFGQFDYDLFQQYGDKNTRKQNSNLNAVTELQSEDNKNWTKTSYLQFNSQGLPTTITQYDQQEKETEKKEFMYDNNGQISKIESYKGDNHFGTAEFEVNISGQIISYTDYVYSSSGGEKMFVWETFLNYNPNQTIREKIKLQGYKKDTVETNFYDTFGMPTKTLQNMSGLRTTKIEYIWNKDKSEMKELNYENDTSVYTTVIHKYKDNKEIERTDPATSPKPFYWKYDSFGRVIETNEGFFCVLYYTYDKNGRMSTKTMNVLFSDSDEKDLPKKFYYKYEYNLQH